MREMAAITKMQRYTSCNVFTADSAIHDEGQGVVYDDLVVVILRRTCLVNSLCIYFYSLTRRIWIFAKEFYYVPMIKSFIVLK